jgi:hypothetical protein
MKSLHLHINRIVVEGLPESGQRRFMRSLEAQLYELAESGIADAFPRNTRKRIQVLNAGQLRSGATPEQAAAQVVRSIRQSVFTNGQTVSARGSSIVSSAPTKTSIGETRHNA